MASGEEKVSFWRAVSGSPIITFCSIASRKQRSFSNGF